MKKLLMALAGLVVLAAGSAMANDTNVVRTQSLQVKERLKDIERIDVTAEKPRASDVEALDDELQAILDDAKRAERAPREQARN